MPRNIISMYSFKGIKMKYYTTMNLPAPRYERFIDIYNSYKNKPLDAIPDFECMLSKFFNVKEVATFTNCFTALSLALQYFTKNRKKTVAIAGLSYRRTTDIVLWSGLQPIYIDNDLNTLGMSWSKLTERLANTRIGCVLLQHPMVNLIDVEKFISVCDRYEVPVLIDSVEATGGTLYGKKVGSIGKIEGFSLHPSKVINGAEGGILTFSSSEEYESFNRYMQYIGVGSKNINQESLFKIEPIHAILGIASLECFDSFRNIFKKQYTKYLTAFKDNKSFKMIEYDLKEKNNFKSILIKINNQKIKRSKLLKFLEKKNIGARPYYHPLHKLTKEYDLDNARILSESLMFLPVGKSVNLQDIEFISRSIVDYGKDY